MLDDPDVQLQQLALTKLDEVVGVHWPEVVASLERVEALYEDDAPHGEATLYFLAGLATYSAVYGEPAPADFALPDDIHPAVVDNYAQVVDEVWAYLEAFDDDQGVSRVW